MYKAVKWLNTYINWAFLITVLYLYHIKKMLNYNTFSLFDIIAIYYLYLKFII